jgi:multidrug efflux pump subunit AcrA (membrane-fusion protein)
MDKLKRLKWWQWGLVALAVLVVIGTLSPAEENDSREAARTVTVVEAPEELPPLNLTVRPPGAGGTVHRRSVTLRGTVTDGATVEVDDEPAEVSGSRWTHEVELDLGTNEYMVIASMPDRQDVVKEIEVVRKRSAAERQALAERRERERQEREAREQARIAARTKRFSGNGSKSIGTVRVEEDSILEWTNQGEPPLRQMLIYDKSFGISVSSDAASGNTAVPAGTYRDITVAGDDWTITIRPEN